MCSVRMLVGLGVVVGVYGALLDRGPEGLPYRVNLCALTGGFGWCGDGGHFVGQRRGLGGAQSGQPGLRMASAQLGVGEDSQVPGSRCGSLPGGAVRGRGLVGLLPVGVERGCCFRGGGDGVMSCGCLEVSVVSRQVSFGE